MLFKFSFLMRNIYVYTSLLTLRFVQGLLSVANHRFHAEKSVKKI